MQTLYDIALQETGTIASVFAIASANNISVTEVLTEGQTIQIPDTIIDANVLKDYLIEGVNPATAFAISVVAWPVPVLQDFSVGGGDRGVNVPATSNVLSVVPVAVSAVAGQGQYDLTVSTNAAFTVAETLDWVNTHINNNGTVTLYVYENTQAVARTGIVTITASNGLSRDVTIVQAAGVAVPSSISVAPATAQIARTGGQQYIYVTANVSYTVTCSASWVTITPSGTLGQGWYNVTVANNATIDRRTATVIVSGGGTLANMVITQLGEEITLELSRAWDWTHVQGGESWSASVASNRAWTAQSDSSWLTVVFDSTSIGVTSSTNLGSQRVGHITLTAGTLTKTITVTQMGVVTASVSNIAKTIPRLTAYTQKPNWSAMRVTMPMTIDSTLGIWRPKWMVFGQLGHSLFDVNNTPFQNGYAGSPDFTGFMVRGRDFIYPTNPDTNGDAWANNTDPTTATYYPPSGKTVAQFVGINPQARVVNFLNSLVEIGSTMLDYYNAGKSQAYLSHFGQGDYIGGKSQGMFISMDVEINMDPNDGQKKKIALMIGAAANTKAFVAEMYAVPLVGQLLNIDHSRNDCYPNSSGVYPSKGALGLTDLWDSDNFLTVDIPTVGNGLKVTDYPNIIPTMELSFYAIEVAKHGTVYQLGNNKQITLNKFGTNWDATGDNGFNVEHWFAKYVMVSELFAWHCQKKLGRRGVFQGKVLADRGANAGLADYITADDGSVVSDVMINRQNILFSREILFCQAFVDYFNGNHKWNWSIAGDNDGSHYNAESNFDGHTGTVACIEMLVNRGCVMQFDEMQPEFWETEYSLDNVNWQKTKGLNLNLSATSVLAVRSKVGSGAFFSNYWEVGSLRPEGIEPTEFWCRATVGGVLRTLHVTPDMWETLDPDYASMPLAQVPTAKKLYFYQKIVF